MVLRFACVSWTLMWLGTTQYCSQTGKAMNTRNISGVLCCVARKKPNRHEKTEPQARTLILSCSCVVVCMSWSLLWLVITVHNKHSWDISSVHGFPGCTITFLTFLGVHGFLSLTIRGKTFKNIDLVHSLSHSFFLWASAS